VKRLWAIWAVTLFGCGLASAEGIPADGLTREEGQSLIRIRQLSDWMGSSVSLATGLCVQRNYAGAWPASGLNSIPMRAENMLLQAWETCNTSGEDLRLVKQVRELLQGQILRLAQPHASLNRCQKETTPAADNQSCFASAFGRHLNEEEQRTLVRKVPY